MYLSDSFILTFQGVLETFAGIGMMAGPAIGGFLYAVSFYKFRPSVNKFFRLK